MLEPCDKSYCSPAAALFGGRKRFAARLVSATVLRVSVAPLLVLVFLLAACAGAPSGADAPASETVVTPAPAATVSPVPGPGLEQPAQTDDKQAAVVVQFNGQQTAARTVAFTETISGLDLLLQSGLDVTTAEFDWGMAVCAIDDTGCPAQNCFCSENQFWAYQFWDGTQWQSYDSGAATTVISQTGAVEGWYWTAMDNGSVSPHPPLSAHSGLHWLWARQAITDGGYGGFGASVEVMLSLGANRIDARTWRVGADSPSLFDYVMAQPQATAGNDVAAAGKLAVALGGSVGCRPSGLVGPQDIAQSANGILHEQAGPLAWAILGEVTLQGMVPAESVSRLAALAAAEGGWEWASEWGVDTNTTALAIQALLAAGHPRESQEIEAGLAFLKRAQGQAGGFTYNPDAEWEVVSDANSTAYVVQALVAAGEEPTGSSWTVDGQTPLAYLLELQHADGGFAWQTAQEATNQAATQQAIPALLGRAYPLVRGPLPACAD